LMVYNTDSFRVEYYLPDAWSAIQAPFAQAHSCTAAIDCASEICVDGYCCNTLCAGNCDRCNVVGSLGICTNVDSDCTGNCDVCTSGNCAASASLCTGNCDQCTGSETAYSCVAVEETCTGNCDTCSGSGTAYSCAAVDATCTGNCDTCSGSGTAYSCAASAGLCTGNCDVCSGSGTVYNCAASNALCSNTASSCYCSGSGTVFNCQSCPDTYGVCGHPTCSSYSCGNAYDNGVYCSTCHYCSSGSCSGHYAAGYYGAGCTASHYRCDGNGNCTAPYGADVCLSNPVFTSCNTTCGARPCVGMYVVPACAYYFDNCAANYRGEVMNCLCKEYLY